MFSDRLHRLVPRQGAHDRTTPGGPDGPAADPPAGGPSPGGEPAPAHGPDADWPVEVDLRGDGLGEAPRPATACPTCEGSMAVEELDLVGHVARLVCGDCGLLRARRLPSLSPS